MVKTSLIHPDTYKIMANSICWKLYWWVETSLINSLSSSTLSLLAQCWCLNWPLYPLL